MAPVAEIILRRRDRQGYKQYCAYRSKGKEFARGRAAAQGSISVVIVHSSSPLVQLRQGRTHDHPGPRKNVPTAVSNISSTRNQVMIQKEIGRPASQRCNGVGESGEKREDHSRAPPTSSVGTIGTTRSST